jgi:hypothetical protein
MMAYVEKASARRVGLAEHKAAVRDLLTAVERLVAARQKEEEVAPRGSGACQEKIQLPVEMRRCALLNTRLLRAQYHRLLHAAKRYLGEP